MALTRNIIRWWPIWCTPRTHHYFLYSFKSFPFLSACIRDLASNWDPFNIILIVTGIEAVIENCLPKVHKILLNVRNWEEKISNNGRWRYLLFVLLHFNACDYLAPLWRYGTSKIMGSRPGSTSYGWSTVTMHLSGTIMEICPFEVLPGRLFEKQRSVVGRSVGPQYYTDLIYSSSLR